jgi:hypothetical protein
MNAKDANLLICRFGAQVGFAALSLIQIVAANRNLLFFWFRNGSGAGPSPLAGKPPARDSGWHIVVGRSHNWSSFLLALRYAAIRDGKSRGDAVLLCYQF